MKADALNEDLIVRYLLGDLPEERLTEIEDRAFRDPEYLQEILAVESDLIDGYVRNELSDSERRLFQSRFLVSAERRQKVEFARNLTRVLPETTVAEREGRPAIDRGRIGLWGSITALLSGLRPMERFALAAAAVLIVIGGSWLATETVRLRTRVGRLQAQQQDQQALENQLAEERARNESLSSRLESEQQQRERREEVIRELEREREGLAETRPTQPTVLSLALLPGIPRSGSVHPKLVLPQSARLVRLQIGIEPGDEHKTYRVELHTQAGQPVWSQDNLSSRSGRSIVVNLPARLLSTGKYELTLKGITDGGQTEDVGYYYFDVMKK
jgi:anti-sigma factor RsiW